MALKMKPKETVMRKPYRIVLAGVGGSGKSTAMGTMAKKALVIDLDKRFPRSLIDRNDFAAVTETFKGVKDYLGEILAETKLENDLVVIDTCTKLMTFIEAWTIQQDCKGDKDKYAAYGHGLKFAHQYFQEILDLLDKIQEKHQVNIAFVCHTKLKTFKSAIGDDYTKNQLDLPDIVADRLLQWADAVGFVYFEVPVDDHKKVKGPSRRVVTLSDAPVHTAKNGLPWTLPEKIDFDIEGKWAKLVFTGATHAESLPLIQQIDAVIESYPSVQRPEIRARFETINYRTLDAKTLKPYVDAAIAAKGGTK
jgi:hypothetical protein